MTVGLSRDARHRYYLDGAGPFPSVTTITKNLSTGDALVGWAKRETAACAIRNLAVLNQMTKEPGGAVHAQQWLQSIPDYQRDAAADLGSRVHALAEATVRGEDVELTDEERPFVDSYKAWLDDIRPDFLVVEEMVWSHHGYAGTLDSIALIDGERWLLDIKTGKAVYDETALQLAAYARADFIGRPNDPVRYEIPRVTRYGVIHVRPERTRLVPFAVDEDVWQGFLALLQLNGLRGHLKGMKGDDYVKRERAA